MINILNHEFYLQATRTFGLRNEFLNGTHFSELLLRKRSDKWCQLEMEWN